MFKWAAQSRPAGYQNILSGSVLIILCCICNVLQMPACLTRYTHIKWICNVTALGKKKNAINIVPCLTKTYSLHSVPFLVSVNLTLLKLTAWYVYKPCDRKVRLCSIWRNTWFWEGFEGLFVCLLMLIALVIGYVLAAEVAPLTTLLC